MVSDFTKTIIIDGDETEIPGERYQTIQAAIADSQHNELSTNGGVIIVEQGTYTIDNSDPNHGTINVPSNVTIIGRGNAVIEVTSDVSAFKNADQTNGNDRITISGFKIEVNYTAGVYTQHLIHMKNVNKSVIEKLTISVESVWGVKKAQGESTPRAILFEGEGTDTPTYCRDNVISQCFIKNFGNKYAKAS